MTNSTHAKKEAAFKNVRAYALLYKKQNASLSLKYPRGGARPVTIFLHIQGLPPVMGKTRGYGYDKTSAAFIDTVVNLKKLLPELENEGGKIWLAPQLEFANFLIDKVKESGSFDIFLESVGFETIKVI